MLWNIAIYDPAIKSVGESLGRVRANNSPRAVLNAIKKFHINDVSVQRRIVATPVVPIVTKPINITDEEKLELRRISGAFNKLFKG